LRWKFDETSGTTAVDSSGKGHDGTVNDANGLSWVNDPERGRCLDFQGGDYVLDNDANSYMDGLRGLTVSLWVKSREIGTDAGFIIFEEPVGQDKRNIRYDSDGGEGDTNLIKYGVTVAPDNGQGDGREEDESPSSLQTTAWQHVVMTWRSGVGLKLYIDGVLQTPEEDAAAYTGATTGYDSVVVGYGGKYGSDADGWNGLIDDVQIYNYPLTGDEVLTVMGGGQIATHSVHYPPASPAELYEGEAEGSRVINFKDYAELLKNWLVELKYPQ